MSDLFGHLTDELGGADEALALAAFAQATASGAAWASGHGGKHAAHPLLKRSKLYYSVRKEGQLVGLDNQSVGSGARDNSRAAFATRGSSLTPLNPFSL